MFQWQPSDTPNYAKRICICGNVIILTYFIRGSITVHLTSCLTCLDSAALLMLNKQQIYFFD